MNFIQSIPDLFCRNILPNVMQMKEFHTDVCSALLPDSSIYIQLFMFTDLVHFCDIIWDTIFVLFSKITILLSTIYVILRVSNS